MQNAETRTTKTIKLQYDTKMTNKNSKAGTAQITVWAGTEVQYTRIQGTTGVTHLVEYKDAGGDFFAVKQEGTHAPDPFAAPFVPAVLTNKAGETLTTTMTDAIAAALFAEAHADKKHWLWYYIHQAAQDLQAKAAGETLHSALALIAHMFTYAIGRGLKRPRIRVVYRDTRFNLYLSKKGTLCFKAAARRKADQDLWHEERFIGCLWQGAFLPARHDITKKPIALKAEEQEFLDALAGNNPVAVAEFLAMCSKDLGRCCYCNHPLDDPDSKKVGYGATCAKNWGLPHPKNAGYTEKAPSFFDLYAADVVIRTGMAEILKDPANTLKWDIVSDRFEEQGLARMKQPAAGVTLPKT